MNQIFLQQNLLTDDYLVEIHLYDENLNSVDFPEHFYHSVSIHLHETFEINELIQLLAHIRTSELLLYLHDIQLRDQQLLDSLYNYLAEQFLIGNVVMADVACFVLFDAVPQMADNNRKLIERSIISTKQKQEDEALEMRRISELEKNLKANRASFLKHKKLYEDAAATITSLEQKHNKQQHELNNQINELSLKLERLQQSYDNLAGSKLGQL
ncbi:hypothetical protein [Macrococcus lamae]|uniref:Uncharacterized protein n=1 Tax=Macrococcus lamae TaxID=198484 RepID=A0A4R6BVR2_9STAP|nr:hypothetical protein [Macrococcus lamae]TDM12287.1 hypothetical protein ERX29_04285 [Macrococcus lamae]